LKLNFICYLNRFFTFDYSLWDRGRHTFLCAKTNFNCSLFRVSKFPGNMHNYIWCPYYLPSFMKFCSVFSEELWWQAASEVYFGKKFSSKGHNSHNIQTNSFFGYSLKLNFICYLNRFFTFDYSLWDRGRHTFLRAKRNFNLYIYLVYVFL
jgi:hypothetical protein